MTLLGSPAFSMGSTGTDPSMGKSLDDMILDRRKEQTKQSKRGPKKASNVDRSIATGRAKREAAIKAKRGLTQTKKPTPMEVEREVYRQSRQTDKEKKAKQKKATGGRIAPDSTGRSSQKKQKAALKKKDPPAAIFGGRAPSKRAIEAAIKGMESSGFRVPKGHQLVMTFVPAVVAPAVQGTKGKNVGAAYKGGNPPKGNNNNYNNNSNNNKQGGGRRKK